MNAAQFSRSLGWFSISLGLAELIAPRRLAHAIGVSENHDRLIRALGAREIASGLGLLARPKPTYFAWSRVAGDIMDLSLLGAACSRVRSQPLSVSRSNDDDRRRLTIAMVVVGAVTAVDFLTSVRLTQKPKTDPKWRYQPPGGRSGLRRPLEVDRPRYLPVDQQPRMRQRGARAQEMGTAPQDDNPHSPAGAGTSTVSETREVR